MCYVFTEISYFIIQEDIYVERFLLLRDDYTFSPLP